MTALSTVVGTVCVRGPCRLYNAAWQSYVRYFLALHRLVIVAVSKPTEYLPPACPISLPHLNFPALSVALKGDRLEILVTALMLLTMGLALFLLRRFFVG